MPIIDTSDDKCIRIRAQLNPLETDISLELKNICKKRIEEKPRDIYLDFSDIKYLDSASIGTVLYLIQLLKKTGHRIHITRISDELRQLFTSLLIDHFVVM